MESLFSGLDNIAEERYQKRHDLNLINQIESYHHRVAGRIKLCGFSTLSQNSCKLLVDFTAHLLL